MSSHWLSTVSHCHRPSFNTKRWLWETVGAHNVLWKSDGWEPNLTKMWQTILPVYIKWSSISCIALYRAIGSLHWAGLLKATIWGLSQLYLYYRASQCFLISPPPGEIVSVSMHVRHYIYTKVFMQNTSKDRDKWKQCDIQCYLLTTHMVAWYIPALSRGHGAAASLQEPNQTMFKCEFANYNLNNLFTA